MLKYVIAWIVSGLIAEIAAGLYVAYYTYKCGLIDLDSFNVVEAAGVYLFKNGSIYLKLLCTLPSGLKRPFGIIMSILFWPVHAIWYANTCVHACDDYVNARTTNEP